MKPNKTGRRRDRRGRSRSKAWMMSMQARCALVTVVASVVIAVILCTSCMPERYDLTVGSISHKTITATKDVADEITTEERRRSAA